MKFGEKAKKTNMYCKVYIGNDLFKTLGELFEIRKAGYDAFITEVDDDDGN